MRRARFTKRLTTTLAAVAVAASTALVAGCGSDTSSDSIVVASPQCAHCLSMSLLPGKMPGQDVTYQNFTKLSDLSTGLASGQINVG
ncbi:hypothetical protein G3I15_45365, partial [Streptomyces sp. SID10244]|nr:hypothetical protein [Streptomyces sp. SID10244]